MGEMETIPHGTLLKNFLVSFFFLILTAVDFYSIMVYLASLCYSWDMFRFPVSHLILSKHVLLIWQFCTINVADRKSQKNLLQYIWPSWNTHLLPIPSRPSFEHLIYVSEEPGNGRYEAMRKKRLSLAHSKAMARCTHT